MKVAGFAYCYFSKLSLKSEEQDKSHIMLLLTSYYVIIKKIWVFIQIIYHFNNAISFADFSLPLSNV